MRPASNVLDKLHTTNKLCGKKRICIVIIIHLVSFISTIRSIRCDLFRHGNYSFHNNNFEANQKLNTNNTAYLFANKERGVTDMEHHFGKSIFNQENHTEFANKDLKHDTEKFFQKVTNTTIESNVTTKYFDTMVFNFSEEVYQCIHEYKELKKYLQKIALIFYFSSKINWLESEDLNHNSKNIWQIENDKTSNTTIKMNIVTHSGEIDNDLDIVIRPGIFINSVHKTNTTWINNILDISNINSTPTNLLNITNSQGGRSTTNCICTFVFEIQYNLGIKRSTLERCIKKIQEITTAIRSNPGAKFELTQLSLDQPPSKLVIPKNLKDKVTGLSWKESIVEGKELVPDNLLGRSKQKLESTYSNGNEILRQLMAGNTGTENRGDGPKAKETPVNIYFDARDINGNSCVYLPFDQGKCGGCYAFVVSASISISNCIQKSELPTPLSPQQIIDCSTNFGNLGCNGGFYSNGWSYLLEQNIPSNHICSWDDYPYVDYSSFCKASSCNGCLNISKYNVFTGLALNGDDGWDFVTTILPKVGSISLSINSDLPGFSSYSDGIYRAPKCTVFSELNHAVIMVGFGISDHGEKYFVIQNSWGTSWGIGGFMNVSANSCDMFWYPGIIRQASPESLPKHCRGNKLLLTGPGEVNKPQRVSKASCILIKELIYGIQLFIITILWIQLYR